MRSKQTIAIAGSMLVALTLVGCATLQTVGRTTDIKDGIAIHLDAQQRLVLARADKYCAEPSPDALSAYVGSLGLGVSSPGQGAASLVKSLQSATGSIGLRTQSITLMRDALYRMCEASNNGHLNELEVARIPSAKPGPDRRRPRNRATDWGSGGQSGHPDAGFRCQRIGEPCIESAAP